MIRVIIDKNNNQQERDRETDSGFNRGRFSTAKVLSANFPKTGKRKDVCIGFLHVLNSRYDLHHITLDSRFLSFH